MDEVELGAPRPQARQVVALSIDYLIKTIAVVTRAIDGELVGAVVYLAISQANLKSVFHDPSQNLRYAAFQDNPPDAARQPISVLAVARELDLPYETTRRHVGKLQAKGHCRREADGGVIIPFGVSSQEGSALAMAEIYRLTLAFVADLAMIGVAAPARRKAAGPDLRRVASRAAVYYVLNQVKLARTALGLNLTTAVVLLAVIRANNLYLLADDARRRLHAARTEDVILSDDLRRPITTYALARDIDMPYETARRQVSLLEEAGFCARQGKGLIVPAEAMVRPELMRSVMATWAETNRFLNDLGRLGIGADRARRELGRAREA